MSDRRRIEVLARPALREPRRASSSSAALDDFGIDVTGRVCLDIGASTGGFTDCLLQRGAARVHAVDVGTRAARLEAAQRSARGGARRRQRALPSPADIGEAGRSAVCDVSFISVTLMLPAAGRRCCAQPGEMVILVKPQFEVGRGQVGKGGIVRDPAVHQAACDRVEEAVRGSWASRPA